MGSKVIAECECGFKTPKMKLGGGMYSYTKVNDFPNYWLLLHNLLFSATRFKVSLNHYISI